MTCKHSGMLTCTDAFEMLSVESRSAAPKLTVHVDRTSRAEAKVCELYAIRLPPGMQGSMQYGMPKMKQDQAEVRSA